MKTVPSNRVLPVLDPVNDGRHALQDKPLERESIPYVISLPEHGIGTFVYTWVTKDHVAGSIFVAFGPAIGDQPIIEATDGVVMDMTRNFDDWRVGKVYLRQDLRLTAASIGVDSESFGLEARFEAAHPAYAYSFHPDGCPRYAATNRLEQAGRIQGSLRVSGRRYEFDTTCARDHSWGTRDWDLPQHWKWLHAQAGPGTCVHFWQINVGGVTDLRGYVFREGHLAEVESVQVAFDKDALYRQTHVSAVIRDTAGRTTRVEGDCFGHFPLIPTPSCTLIEGAMRCEIDGKSGVGWSEFMWPTAYLEHLRRS